MFGGDNQELYSDSSSASNVSPPENNNSEGQNSLIPGDNVQNEMPQHADTVINNSKVHSVSSSASVVSPLENNNSEGQNSPFQHAKTVIKNSKELEDDLKELGKKIKHHEDNINFLKRLTNELNSSILDMKVAIGKHLTKSSSKEENDNPEHNCKKKTKEQIMKYKNSAAALFCDLTNKANVSSHFLVKDVVGVVALLGKVDDPNLSRLLSEYLGLETMLAVVCKTYKGLESLEAYSGDGSVNEGLGIHSFAASVGSPSIGPFNVICIDYLSPYAGEFVADDPQRRLDLIKPRLINGETPPGFLGFAVNMIMIDDDNLNFVSKYGHSLRETLFYNLSSNTQVYKSREDMQKAAHLIPNGAISLDGEMMRSPSVFTIGGPRDIDVKFPCKNFSPPPNNLEIVNQLKEAKLTKGIYLEDLKRERLLLDNVMFRFQTKKREFVQFLVKIQSFAAPQVAP